MSEVEAHPDIVEVRIVNHLDKLVGSGKLIRDVLKQDLYSERFRERAQMLDRSHGRFELLLAKVFVWRAQVLNQKPERNLLGDLQRALDFVHRLNTASAVCGRNVHRWRP